MMFKQIFLFELKYRFKRPATWVYFGILFAFGLFVAIGGNGPSSEKVLVNSPVTIANMMGLISIFGILMASAVMGVPVYRDIEHRTENHYFALPVTEKGYILGRFMGSMVTLLLISLGLHLGFFIGFPIGSVAGFEEAERFGPFNFWHYLQPTLTLYWSNFFFAGCIFFSLVSLSRKIMLAYAGGAILFIGYLVTTTLAQDLESKDLVSLLDPFALGTFSNITQYWTPEEQNTQMIPFSGILLWNRLLWVGMGLLIFAYTLFRFDFRRFLEKRMGTSKKNKVEEKDNIDAASLTKIPSVAKVFSSSFNWNQFFKLSWMEFKNITRDNFFRAILIAAVAFLFFDAWFGFPIYGTPSLPMTYYMLEVKDFTYVILVFVLIVFITGEVIQ